MPTLNYFDKDKQEWVAIPLGGGSDSVITAHDGPVPDAGADTPKGLEDAFAGLADGLHYFRDAGSLVAITRQEYQTTIAITGQLNSHVKIVKSQAGLPTPQNPSLAVMQTPEGQYLKLSSDELDKPFGNPQRVDLFALQGGEGGVVDLTNYYTKPEIDSTLTSITDQISAIGDLNLLNSQLQALATITQGVMDKVDTKADKTTVATLSTTLMNSIMEVKADTYTKPEVDAKIEAEKDFSIANDNILLASITSLQEIVSNLGGDIGTGQIDVLDAIRGVEIEPSMVTFSGDTTSPIAWKGGLSLTPVKEGDHWRLNWNDGKAIHTLVHGDEFTSANIVAALASQDVSVANLQTGGLELNELFMGAAGDRLITQVAGGPENTVAYLSDIVPPTPVDLSAYAKVQDNDQQLLAKTIVAQAVGFGGASEPLVALAYKDMGEGYGERLTLAIGLTNEYLVYKSDLDSLFPATDAYTKAECDGKFLTLADVYTQKQVDDKLAVINPTASPSINDPALAAFKKSVLDAVKLMLAGGTKMPPADIDWTPIIRMEGARETTSTQIEARMLGGFIELKGTLTFTAGITAWVPLRLPPQFPMAEIEAKFPLAMRLVGSAVTYGYCTVSNKNRDIAVSPGAQSNEAAFSGIRWKAAY
jgi:hypothetical protein